MRRKLLGFLPVLCWIAVIFYVSSQPYQEQTIIPFLESHLSDTKLKETVPDVTVRYNAIRIEAKDEPFQFLEFLFRKSAHMVTYAVLAFFTILALSFFKEKPVWKCVYVLGLAAAISTLDEYNQSASATRMGTIQDVGIDMIGACIGLAIGLTLLKLNNKGPRYGRQL